MHVAFPSRRGRCFRNVGDVNGRVLDAALKEALRLNSGADGGGKSGNLGVHPA